MDKKEGIVILGRGGHAKAIINIIEKSRSFNIVGITDIDAKKGETFLGYPMLGNDDVLPKFLLEGVKNLAIGIGGFKDNTARTKLFERVLELGFDLPPIIHPSANIASRTEIGKASIIFSGVNLNVGVKIGSNTIIATGSNIDHESNLGDNVLISSGVSIGANVEIGDGVLCALGSNVISGVSINNEIVIGAGAVVVNDLSDKGTYIGCPAKIM